MSDTIFQSNVHDQFRRNQADFVKTHWIHSDGHISTKHGTGKLLNRWIVTRAIFRSICGIQLKKTINKLKQESSKSDSTDKRLNFNSTCDFLVGFINQLNTKHKTQYINELNALKFKIQAPRLSAEKEKEVEDKVKNLPAGMDDQTLQNQLQDILKNVDPKEQEDAIAVIMKNAPDYLADKIYKTSVLPTQPVREKVVKLQQVNLQQMQQILQDETLHNEVQSALSELAKTDLREANKIVQIIKQAVPTGKALSPQLKSVCEEIEKQRKNLQHPFINDVPNLNKLPAPEFAKQVRSKLATGKNDEERLQMMEALFQQVDPRHAVELFSELSYSYPISPNSKDSYGFSETGAKLEGLIENPKALEAVLSDPKTYSNLNSELSKLSEREPQKASQVVDQMQKKGSLQNFTKAVEKDHKLKELAELIANIPESSSKPILDTFENKDTRLPHLTACLSMAKVPDASEEVLKALFESAPEKIIESVTSRPLREEHVKHLFNTPAMQIAAAKLKNAPDTAQATHFIIDLGEQLKWRFSPYSLERDEDSNEFNDFLYKAVSHQTPFLKDDRYEKVVPDEYIEGFNIATDELSKIVDALFNPDQKKALEEEIKKTKNLDLNIFLLLLLIKLNPDNAPFAASKVAYAHEFCLLFRHMSPDQQKAALTERVNKLRKRPEGLKKFKDTFMAFVDVPHRNEWSKFLENLIGENKVL